MGFLDSIRDRLSGSYDDDYDDDDYYDDDYEDDYDEPTGSGILGNTSRPEAESVAVYTRSGRPVGTNAGAPATGNATRPLPATAARTSSSYGSYRRNRDDFDDGIDDYAPSGTYNPPAGMNASGQLPPYVLRCEAYEDVQTVVRRVRTNQPVLLVLNDTPADIAQRILDFSFGLSFGVGGEVQPIEAKAFLVLPQGIQLSPAEIDRLAAQAR